MRKTLKVVAFGGGPADAFIKAAGITNSTQQTAIKTLVNDLNGYGLWSKMKAIYPMVGGTASSHSYNLKDTTKFQITWYGGITHDSSGAKMNGTNSYGTLTTWNQLSNTNYGYGNYITTNIAENTTSFGITDVHTIFRSGGGSTFKRKLGVSTDNYLTSDSRALFHRYSSSGLSSAFYNTTKKLTGTGSTSFNYPTLPIHLGADPYQNSYSSHRFAFSFLSEYLNDTEASNLYTAIQKFQTTLSRQV